MKKSEFKSSIKNEIIDILEASAEDVEQQQAYNAELEKTAQLAKDAGMVDEGDDQDDGYVNHTYNDSVIDKYNIPVEPTAVFEEGDDHSADYQDIGQAYNENRRYRKDLTDADLEVLGKIIVDRLFKGDIGKAYDEIVMYDSSLKLEEEDDEPKAKDLKGEPLSRIGYKLADTQDEMKKVVKKWSAAEGSEKEKLYDRLRVLNKIKKELESLLENKK